MTKWILLTDYYFVTKISEWSSEFLKYIKVSKTTKMSTDPAGGDVLRPADEAEAKKRQDQFTARGYFEVGYNAFFKRPIEENPRLVHEIF